MRMVEFSPVNITSENYKLNLTECPPLNPLLFIYFFPDEIVVEKEKYRTIGDGIDLAFVEVYGM